MSVSAVRVTLQPAHGYVPLVVIGAGLVGVWASFKVGAARKQYSVSDPQICAEKKKNNVTEFDCVQRAHQNVLENLPLFYATLATSSIYRPKVAAVAGVVRIVGFIMYVKGTGDPKKSRHGTFGYLGMLVMLGLSLEASLRISVTPTNIYTYCNCSKSLLSFGAILLLLVAMSSERFLFKVMVDRMESYRYFLFQFMTFLYIPPMFCIVGYKATHDNLAEDDGMEFPKFCFFVMGLLDLLHGLMLFIAGGRTDPTQTLLFMQASIPISACMSAAFFGVRYTRPQVVGMLAITGGLVLSLIPCIEDIHSEKFDDREIGWNSIFYLFAAIPGSLSMLYKERMIRDQPVNMSYLNAWVSVNQFVAGLLTAPLIFDAEFLHLDQKSSGLMCLIQGKSEVSTDHCYVGLPILILYVFSNIVVNLLLLQLVRLTSVSTMYGCTLAGFVTSFVVLAWYQVDPDNFGIINLHDGLRNWIPPSIFVDVFAFLVIFAGKVLYQWDSDPKVEATTLSAEDKEVMSLLDGEDDYGLRYT